MFCNGRSERSRKVYFGASLVMSAHVGSRSGLASGEARISTSCTCGLLPVQFPTRYQLVDKLSKPLSVVHGWLYYYVYLMYSRPYIGNRNIHNNLNFMTTTLKNRQIICNKTIANLFGEKII